MKEKTSAEDLSRINAQLRLLGDEITLYYFAEKESSQRQQAFRRVLFETKSEVFWEEIAHGVYRVVVSYDGDGKGDWKRPAMIPFDGGIKSPYLKLILFDRWILDSDASSRFEIVSFCFNFGVTNRSEPAARVREVISKISSPLPLLRDLEGFVQLFEERSTINSQFNLTTRTVKDRNRPRQVTMGGKTDVEIDEWSFSDIRSYLDAQAEASARAQYKNRRNRTRIHGIENWL